MLTRSGAAAFLFAGLSSLSCGPRLLPITHDVGAISCDALHLQVLSDDYGEDPTGPQEAYFSRIDVEGRTTSTVPIGTGAVMDSVAFLGPTIVAVLYEFSVLGDRPDKHHIVRTRDGGRTWRPLESPPPKVTGVAFANPEIGWSWSDHALYATSNSGDDWKQLPIPDGSISRSGPLPIVVSGNLWVPLNHGLGPDSRINALVRVCGDDVSVVRSSDPFTLAALTSHQGDLWAVTDTPNGQGVSSLYRIDVDHGGEAIEISSLPPGRPAYLAVHDDGIVVALTAPFAEGGRPSLTRSTDGGHTWSWKRPLLLLEDGFCSTSAEQVWFISNIGTVQLLD